MEEELSLPTVQEYSQALRVLQDRLTATRLAILRRLARDQWPSVPAMELARVANLPDENAANEACFSLLQDLQAALGDKEAGLSMYMTWGKELHWEMGVTLATAVAELQGERGVA